MDGHADFALNGGEINGLMQNIPNDNARLLFTGPDYGLPPMNEVHRRLFY